MRKTAHINWSIHGPTPTKLYRMNAKTEVLSIICGFNAFFIINVFYDMEVN